MTFKHLKTGLVATVAFSALISAAPALAQPPSDTPEAASEPESNGDIVVTARRREESLINVPIAVTAYSGEQLENQGALDLTDIADTTPNVTLEASRGTNSTLTAFIRGVGQQDPVAGFEAGVGIYIDDVYLNRPQAALLDIYDVERIEVLRGPQGTLYGRNTIGGAIKYVTRRLPDVFTVRLRGTVGNYDQADVVGSVSAPVAGDAIRAGITVARLSRGGFGTNLTTGQANYNRDIWAGRATVEIEPSSQLFVRLSADLTVDDSNPRGGHRLIAGLFTGAPVLANVYDTQGGLLDPTQHVENRGYSAYISAEPTDWLTLRSITAYREDESNTPIDFDALPAVDVDVPAVYNNSQFSQELQALVSTGGFNGLLGFYYLSAQAETIFDVRLPNGVTALTFGNVDTETYAIFGDFTYDFSPQFSVSVGGRYTWDQRNSRILRQTFLGGGSPFFNGAGTLFATTSDFTGTADFSRFTPRASVSFRPREGMNLYASYSRGFKGGGFDPRGVSTAAPDTNADGVRSYQEIYDFLSFDPETVDSYEVGYRAQLFDRRLTIGLTAFYADYSDVQVPGSVGTVINGQQTFIGVTTNAAAATFKGVEFEGQAVLARDFGRAGDRLSLSWSLGYLDAQYDRFIDARGIDVASRRAIQNTPDLTASATLDYSVPVGPGRLGFNTTVSYRSDSQQFELATPGLDQPGYALWDASLTWRSDNDNYNIGLHVKNITDERYIVSGYNFLRQNPDTGQFILANGTPGLNPTLGREGVLTGYYGNPFQVFLSVGFRFQ